MENCRSFGANVRTEGAHIGEAMVIAKKMAAEQGERTAIYFRKDVPVIGCLHAGLTYINGYDDEAIIAGQGTCALEILEQVAMLFIARFPMRPSTGSAPPQHH